MELRQVFHDQTVLNAFRRAPEVMARHVEQALKKAAARIAAEARIRAGRNAAFSNLVNSILPSQISQLHFRVRAGAAHARFVEEGTGPAVGRKSYMPPPQSLEAYVRLRAGIRWRGRAGGATRRSQQRDVRARAFALALHIRKHGTKPHPFLRPAAEMYEDLTLWEIRMAAYAGARETFRQ